MTNNLKNRYYSYWVVYNAKNDSETLDLSSFTLCSTQEVRGGKSPLGADGEKHYVSVLMLMPVKSETIWVFSKEYFLDAGDQSRFTEALISVFQAVAGVYVSRQGLILRNSNDELLTTQPANFECPSSCGSVTLSDNDFIAVDESLASVFSLDHAERETYLYIFDYLSKIRQSDYFVGQTSLWGFVEHYWAADKSNSNLSNSLKRFLEYVFPEPRRQERSKIRKMISEIGARLGKEYDELSLRNILSHGKHFTLKEGWDNKSWVSFYELSDIMMHLVFVAIHRELLEIQK